MSDARDGIDPNNQCPICGYTIDAAGGTPGVDRRPHAGDVSLCMQCAAILEFAAGPNGLQVVEPNLAMMREYVTNKDIIKARMAVLTLNLRHN